MGCDFDTLIVRHFKGEKDVKKAFQEYQDSCSYESGHSYSGLLNMCPGLEFHDKVFESYQDAEEYLSETCQKWENAIAVQFKQNEKVHYLIGGHCSS